MKYQVGNTQRLKEDDPWFDELSDAEEYAAQETSWPGCEDVYVVFDENHCTMSLAYQGDIYIQ